MYFRPGAAAPHEGIDEVRPMVGAGGALRPTARLDQDPRFAGKALQLTRLERFVTCSELDYLPHA